MFQVLGVGPTYSRNRQPSEPVKATICRPRHRLLCGVKRLRSFPMKTSVGLLLAILSSALVAQSDAAPPVSSEPVVLTGKKLPTLLGKPPHRIVAFAFRKGWQRIPVQIDERAVVPYSQILRRRVRKDVKGLVYTDPNTFTGDDPDPNFDADDELVVLAADAGAAAPEGNPDGVRAESRVELIVRGMPKDADHVYLFDSTADPAPGPKRVRYEFRLKAGAYLENYELRNRPNPENSTITTAAYRLGFRDRWVMDELRLTIGDVAGADILDLHKVQVIPGNCIRTTRTFSHGSGAMITNIDGPVRAIRAVIGANSGPLTERIWICYPRRFDIITYLRVHALPSVFMFFDYSADALGMRYYDNHNLGGFEIDGKADPVKTGKLLWQFVTGKQGSLRIHFLLDTTIKTLIQGSLYDDNRKPVWKQCTGDSHSFGAAGPLLQHLASTDPRLDNFHKLTSRVVVYPGAAGKKLDDPARMTAPKPLQVEVRTTGK